MYALNKQTKKKKKTHTKQTKQTKNKHKNKKQNKTKTKNTLFCKKIFEFCTFCKWRPNNQYLFLVISILVKIGEKINGVFQWISSYGKTKYYIAEKKSRMILEANRFFFPHFQKY